MICYTTIMAKNRLVMPPTYVCSKKGCPTFVKHYGERCKKHRLEWSLEPALHDAGIVVLGPRDTRQT